MIITHATKYDIEGIADCAERFFEYAKYEEEGMPLCRESFKRMMLDRFIDKRMSVCLLLKDSHIGTVRGGICGFVTQWGYNDSIKIGVEHFYWVDLEFRGINSIKLKKAYEKEIYDLGAVKNIMVEPNTHLSAGVARLYGRSGYKPHERFWIK